jgi:hypothetical protein
VKIERSRIDEIVESIVSLSLDAQSVFHSALRRDSKGRPQRGADVNGERLPSPDKEAKAEMIIPPKPDHSSSSQASALAP